MKSKAYTVLGWLVWQAAKHQARRKLEETHSRAVPLAVIAAVAAAGIALGRGDED